jgi:hypothetical protein
MYANQTQTIPLGSDFALFFNPITGGNITGWTLLFTVSPILPQRDEGNLPISALFTAVPTITDAPNGKFNVVISSAACQTMGAGTYDFSVWRTDTGQNDEIASGQLIIQNTARRYT